MNPESAVLENEFSPRLERLIEIGCTLNISSELLPFLHLIVYATAKMTRCEEVPILELEEGKDQLRFLALPWFHRDPPTTIKVPVQTSVAGWVLQNGQPAVILDVRVEARHFKDIDRSIDFINHSLMAVSISCRGEVVGVLEVVNKSQQAHYTEKDLKILETLTSQVVIAIQDNHLERKVQDALDQMNQLDRMKCNSHAHSSHELHTSLGIILGPATGEVTDSLQQEAQQKKISMRDDNRQGDLLMESNPPKTAIELSNPVNYAMTFTNSGGHIFIVTESIPGYVKVAVIDDNIGIPVKDLPYFIDRFYQVELFLTRNHDGGGLGLSVVIAEIHGGRIWVECVEVRGGNFTFLLSVYSTQLDTANRVFTY